MVAVVLVRSFAAPVPRRPSRAARASPTPTGTRPASATARRRDLGHVILVDVRIAEAHVLNRALIEVCLPRRRHALRESPWLGSRVGLVGIGFVVGRAVCQNFRADSRRRGADRHESVNPTAARVPSRGDREARRESPRKRVATSWGSATIVVCPGGRPCLGLTRGDSLSPGEA